MERSRRECERSRARVRARSAGGRVRSRAHSRAMPDAVALRVKLLRGSEGAELDDGGNITAVSGRAATEKLLEVGDCILDHTALHPSSKCEVTLLRYDEDLATAVQGHGQGNSNDHIPCYRMMKVPLRSVVEGYEIVVNGLRVKELQGQLLADALLRLDDLIVAVDGARVDSAGLLAALRRKADSMQIFTVLRRCSDYDVRTEVQNKKGSCIPETVEDVQSASVVDAQDVPTIASATKTSSSTETSSTSPKMSSSVKASGSTKTIGASDVSNSNVQDASSSEQTGRSQAQSRKTVHPPQNASQKTERQTTDDDFQPFNESCSIWSDIPVCVETSSTVQSSRSSRENQDGHDDCRVFDADSGVWSDVACQAEPAVSQIDGRDALLDVMIQQALAKKDDKLLRRLVTAQQVLRSGAPSRRAPDSFVTLE